MNQIRILHVDDEPDIRELVDMSLALNSDFQVRACSSGAEAIKAAAEWSPYLILLDVMMPGMDGPTTLMKLGLILAVPRLRRLAAEKARPKVRDIWDNLKTIASSPRKLALLLGGSFAQELFVAMALSVSLRAFDDHLKLPVLIVVIMLAAMLGGVAPTPGGLGVVEAGMILGLTAAGVSEADATAAVFIQRLFSSYLPPIWGWATLVWMRKRDYL